MCTSCEVKSERQSVLADLFIRRGLHGIAEVHIIFVLKVREKLNRQGCYRNRNEDTCVDVHGSSPFNAACCVVGIRAV